MADSIHDRWLLPRRQTEYPAWDVIGEARLHGRREATFLALAAIFLVTTASLAVLGTSRIVDPSDALASVAPDRAFPIAMQIPFGVLPFALGCLALTLVAELYGRRRATVLAGIGLVAMLALAGLMRLADQVDGNASMFGPALGFAAGYLVSQLIYVPLFDAMRWRMAGRHLWLRLLVLSVVAQLAGWAVFGVATYGIATALAFGAPPSASIDTGAIVALATGSALYTLAAIALLTLPVALLARGLALFLRVARHDGDEPDDAEDDDAVDDRDADADDAPIELVRRRLPKAQIVDEAEAAPEGQIDDEDAPLGSRRRRRAVASIQPFSSAEMRFFQEGDQLAEGTES
jgi:uncharacterized PurR-regulated membrane protein YhhQ (DUF165 family)